MADEIESKDNKLINLADLKAALDSLDVEELISTPLPIALGGTGVNSISDNSWVFRTTGGLSGSVRSNAGLPGWSSSGVPTQYAIPLTVNNGGTGVTTDAAIGLKAYPVGAVYISYVSTSPASLFGGTWTQITDVFLRAANDVSTGGSDTITLTTAQMPKHNHNVPTTYFPNTQDSGYIGKTATGNQYVSNLITSVSCGYAGSSSAFSNTPAYQDLYVWRRTA